MTSYVIVRSSESEDIQKIWKHLVHPHESYSMYCLYPTQEKCPYSSM